MQKHRWPLGINTCGDLTIEALDIIAEAGFDYVYIDRLKWDDPEADTGAQVLAARPEIKPHSVHLPVYQPPEAQGSAEQLVDHYSQCLKLASTCGVKNATFHCGRPAQKTEQKFQGGEWGSWGSYESICQCLREIAATANEFGIAINAENLLPDISGATTWCFPEELIQLVDDVGASNIGVCLDTGHCKIAGGDPAQFTRTLGSYLNETHFEDNYAPRFAGQPPWRGDLHRPPGIGLIDWPSVMDALVEIGYTGPVVFELELGWEIDSLRTHAETAYRNWRRMEEAWHIMQGQV